MAFRVEEKDVAMDVRASSIIQSNEQSHFKKDLFLSTAFPTGGGGRERQGGLKLIQT